MMNRACSAQNIEEKSVQTLAQELERERIPGKRSSKWESNIKTNQTGREKVGLWRMLLNTVIDIQIA
jgi:hypothetical protein